jgi:hypothetical protein
MAAKVFDLLEFEPQNRRWDFDLLRIGRHVRCDSGTKVILGRREEENVQLRQLFQREDAREGLLLEPENFLGPTALIVGTADDATVDFAGSLMLRYCSRLAAERPRVWLHRRNQRQVHEINSIQAAEFATTLS